MARNEFRNPQDTSFSDVRDEDLEECGGSMSPPPQSDSSNVNVSMTGSGPGGIRNILNILRQIETDDQSDSDDERQSDRIPIVKQRDSQISMPIIDNEAYENDPAEEYYFCDSITQTGTDLHSKHRSPAHRAVAGGDNALREELMTRLNRLYERIKAQ